jgi:hypothetical protein
MTHLTDAELLLLSDEECTGTPAAEHLRACAQCATRQAELLQQLEAFSTYHRAEPVPPAPPLRRPPPTRAVWGLGAVAAAAAILFLFTPRADRIPFPQRAFTPGAVKAVSYQAVCEPGAEAEPPAISPAVAAEVFQRYGIRNPPPRAYEVDYLIPPGLGGSNEPANLWPQPYNSGTWNSRVKDALEDRLQSLVCSGAMPLADAQKEIAADWVSAYKRHFRTDRPLPDHLAFVKDRPWE